MGFQNTSPLSGFPCSFPNFSYLHWRSSAASRHFSLFLQNFAPDNDWLRFSLETRYCSLSGAPLQLVAGYHISRLMHEIHSMFLSYLTNVAVFTWGPVSVASFPLEGSTDDFSRWICLRWPFSFQSPYLAWWEIDWYSIFVGSTEIRVKLERQWKSIWVSTHDKTIHYCR